MLYPRRCPACRDIVKEEGALICSGCRDSFKKVAAPNCIKCGRHIFSEEQEYCYECTQKKHAYTRGIAVFEYDDKMRESIGDFKFRGRRQNGEYYSAEAVRRYSEQIRRFAPDALVPVPVHRSRRALRGYNQAEVLADGIGSRLGIPVYGRLLKRVKKTTPQRLLGGRDRQSNLRHAFECDLNFINIEKDTLTRIMLVDDIYTTGSTADACANALIEAGVSEVGIISICIGRGY